MKPRRRYVSSFAFNIFCLLAILAPLNLPSFAFTASTATITGRVYDLNDAAIPKARVDGTNIDTNITYSTMTNSEGLYVLANLPPGRYRLSVTKEGFKMNVYRDVTLHVQDVISISFAMELGSINQSITVDGGAPLVQSESATVGTLVDRQFVENLPLNGRSFQSLITLTPGSVITKTNTGEQGQFSVNGQRANANYFTIDGVGANISVNATIGSPGQNSAGSLPGFSAAGGTNNLVSIDALQEFKVLTSTYAPEFGRTPGAQVSLITRSGTNAFKGVLFEYFRNDVLDANDWFNNRNGFKKPPLRQNNFGGVLGGPVIKNRTFFFFSYEGLRLRQPQTVTSEVPSKEARQIAPPYIRQFLNAFPVPNGPVTTNGFAQFGASFSNPSTLDATSIRIDHTLGTRLTLFGRYSYAPSETVQRGAGNMSLNTLTSTQIKTQTVTAGATLVITPTISNDLRVNYSRNRGSSFVFADDFGGAVVPESSAIFPAPYSPQNAGLSFNLVRRGSVFSVGKSVNNLQRQINVVNNLSSVIRLHQLKFGVDYRRLSPFYGIREYFQLIGFGVGVTGPGGAATAGSAISGTASSVTIASSDPSTLFFTNLSAYAQDTWRATNRLSITYGTRWDYNPPPTGESGRNPLAIIGLNNPSTMAAASQGTPLYQSTYTNFAPRIGIAYKLFQRTNYELILRGGWGMFYDLGTGYLGNVANSLPFVRSNNLFSPALPLSPAQASPPRFSITPPFSGTIYTSDPDLKLPLTYQWNFAVEQSLGANQTISASYVAAIGRKLLRQELFNRPNSNFTSAVNITRNTATSDYHSLQLQYQRRLSRGLQALSSFTWSHSLDTASNDSSILTPAEKIDPRQDRGPSDFDVRAALTAAITYNIPNLRASKLSNAVLGNWSVDAIVTARSATPVNVRLSKDLGFGFLSFRPNLLLNAPLYLNDPTVPGGRRINKNAFADPGLRQGTLGRNALRGFPASQLDLALRRQFNFMDRYRLQFRVELFNALNHPNFGDPEGLYSDGLFGISRSMLGRSLGSGGSAGGFAPLYQVGGPRSIQLTLKLHF